MMEDHRLKANEFLYAQALSEVERLWAENHPESLEAIERAARIAWFYHAGRFADGALENRLLEAGRELAAGYPAEPRAGRSEPGGEAAPPRRTLHVATEVYRTGGHTRLLAEWIRRDASVSHQLVLTRQREPLPAFVEDLCRERGVDVVSLDRESPVRERARTVRELAVSASLVALHHNPDDAVPVVALAASGGTPVVMCNHAHFSFSLGPSVSDLVLNTLEYYAQISRRSRFVERVEVVPVGAFAPFHPRPVDKRAAKSDLGLPEDRPVLLTIGNEVYYRPKRGQDFFATIEKLMARQPEFTMVCVGIDRDSALVPRRLRRSGRMRLVGVVDDPTPYYRAADICLESFPTPSLGAVVESMFVGAACPVFSYAERESILRPELSPRFPRARNEEEYLDQVCGRMEDMAATSALVEAERNELAEKAERAAGFWMSLNASTFGMEHRAAPIPQTRCETDYDNILLAQSGRDDIGYHLLGLCMDAPWRAVEPHLKAMANGYEGYGKGVWRLGRVGYRTIRRSLGKSYGAVRRFVGRHLGNPQVGSEPS